ncbi:(S)-2-hydroxypropylphosphonic acid epoxidase [Fundidesulfovibrio magnetotacticus]|uniref:(S)-2-hydroxypropylphosphonic acid epoxidase n=1 Tax=Fundidesulfovibrio magnetotacticus TaxID=2730080 RepID=A0A6V8LMQ9_9BACT|nr:XRE family transcriptional regulator [Fundidesulfovibrio magnetotacticus]GFK92280.1 (S)-2-hydroxypropylphosphonic acid epoxidase [Fundidesulfovibrio magnetotacticus]
MSLPSTFDRDISRRIKDLRDALDITPDELAKRVGCTPEEITNYESGSGEVPVSYLYALAKATGVDLTALITGSEAKLHQYCLVKKNQGLAVTRRKAYKYQALAYRFNRPSMEPFLVTVPPREREELEFNHHAGEEFIYLLEGRLELLLGKDVVVMNPHDSLYFSSTIPHAMRGLDGKEALFLDVIN